MDSFVRVVYSILSDRNSSRPDFEYPECGGKAHVRVRRPSEGSTRTTASGWCEHCCLNTQLCSLEWRPQLEAYQSDPILVVLSDRLLREACSQYIADGGFAAVLEPGKIPPKALLTEASRLADLSALEIEDSRILFIGGSGNVLCRRAALSELPALDRPYDFEWIAKNLSAEFRKVLKSS